MLDPRRLQALHAVVDTGSIRAAAEKLGYTPSAISQHVAALATETRTVLLESAGRGIRPTAAGRLLAGHAEDILARMTEAESALAALNAGRSGVLTVASFATAGAELVPRALARVRKRLPDLEISLRIADRDEAVRLLRDGTLDLAVIDEHGGQPDRLSGIAFTPLLVDPFRLVLPQGHPLAAAKTLGLAQAADEPWIDLRCEVGCCREATTAAFQRAGFTPRRTVQAEEYWPAQGFVAAGLGLALIPEVALSVLHRKVVVRPLRPADQPERQVRVATRSAVAATTPASSMLRALQAEAASR